MKKRIKKLNLNRETVRHLDAKAIGRVVGGVPGEEYKDWEDTVTDTINSGPAACGGTLSYYTYC